MQFLALNIIFNPGTRLLLPISKNRVLLLLSIHPCPNFQCFSSKFHHFWNHLGIIWNSGIPLEMACFLPTLTNKVFFPTQVSDLNLNLNAEFQNCNIFGISCPNVMILCTFKIIYWFSPWNSEILESPGIGLCSTNSKCSKNSIKKRIFVPLKSFLKSNFYLIFPWTSLTVLNIP